MCKMEAATKEAKNSRGKKRVRTKGLQKKLLEQVEFYFGDANLQKDRFLKQKMKEHPEGYISVETIAEFNKMKCLTSDISLVVQVMKKSELVELSSDEKWVRRSKPLHTATDTDDRTIYVEHLPPSSSQDSVRKLFKGFGDICYVSLPRYKQSGTVKGFSFVEFSTVEAATTALEYFKTGSKANSLSMPLPDKSCGGEKDEEGEEGRGAEHVEDKEAMEGEGEDGEGDDDLSNNKGERGSGVGNRELESDNKETESSKRKRGRDSAEGGPGATEDIVPVAKKSRGSDKRDIDPSLGEAVKDKEIVTGTEKAIVTSSPKTVAAVGEAREKEVEKGTRESGGGAVEDTQSRKRKRGNEASSEVPGSKTVRLDPQSSGGGGGSDGKKVRLDSLATETEDDESHQQQKKRKKNRQHKKWDWEAALRNLQLRVMSKKEWLEMREIFHSLQKEKVKEMKQQLKEEGTRKAEKAFVGRCLVKVEGIGVGEGDDVVTLEKVQEICSKYGAVAYTDIEEGASEGYIRYSVSGCVENLVNAEALSGIKFTAVSDEDERAYYLKTVAKRRQLAQAKRIKKKRNIRGQDKIISRALQHQSHRSSEPNKTSSPAAEATHIRFSDSEHES